MSGPVDVLAVMERHADFTDCGGKSRNLHHRETADELRQARAAVAELVEAAKRAYAVLDGYVTADDSTDEEIKACDDFWAALAKFGGAA